ncbi:ribbon-helix-helix protein, CopG family [Octadecabacter sp. 1_MG-2023]|uniref:ribbon-helix-helix protein, CopG family n=1 Tax=Octadecabacter sp. 1_MG-2023 TaxID=3062636 RepID=UPI0034C60D01
MQILQGLSMKKAGRPKKETEQVCVRCEMDLINALDSLRDQEEDQPNRPEMVRRIIERYLEDQNG